MRLPCWGRQVRRLRVAAARAASRERSPEAEQGGSSALILSALLHAGILFPNAAGSFAPEKNVFAAVRVVTHRHGLLREVAVTPHSEAFKTPGQPALGGPA